MTHSPRRRGRSGIIVSHRCNNDGLATSGLRSYWGPSGTGVALYAGMNNFDMIVANAHCVECHDFVEPVGKTAHAVLCSRDEDEATVATLTAEMDDMIYDATANQATAAALTRELDLAIYEATQS